MLFASSLRSLAATRNYEISRLASLPAPLPAHLAGVVCNELRAVSLARVPTRARSLLPARLRFASSRSTSVTHRRGLPAASEHSPPQSPPGKTASSFPLAAPAPTIFARFSAHK